MCTGFLNRRGPAAAQHQSTLHPANWHSCLHCFLDVSWVLQGEGETHCLDTCRKKLTAWILLCCPDKFLPLLLDPPAAESGILQSPPAKTAFFMNMHRYQYNNTFAQGAAPPREFAVGYWSGCGESRWLTSQYITFAQAEFSL